MRAQAILVPLICAIWFPALADTCAPAARLQLGFSLTFAQVDESNAPACDMDGEGPRAPGPGPTVTNARDNIVLHYDRAEIRARTQTDLATMFAAGATALTFGTGTPRTR